MAIDVVPVNEQARANGLMWGAKIIGTSASLALGSWLLNQYGYTSAILMLSIVVGLIMLVPLSLRERPGEKILPWSNGGANAETKKMQLSSWADIFNSLYRVFSLRNSLVLAVLVFITQGSFNYIATLLPIFTVQALGWSDQAYSNYFATASLVGGIGGMLIGGILIDRFGKIRMMNIYLLLLVCLTIGFVLLKLQWSSTWFIVSFMIVYQLLYVFTCIGVFAIAMQCCWKKVSASQFTIYMTISNMGRIVGAKLIGPVKIEFSWEYTVLAFAILMLTAWIIIQFLHMKNHLSHLENLEAEFSEKNLKISYDKS
ncbi:MAG: MFS transporter [Saprospiraceae bacterium]|nr:MFS transporter [Candidatus Vicinibacter affinis]